MNREDELLLSFAEDKLKLCDENCMLTNTRFLDIRQQSVVFGHYKRDNRCFTAFYGGYDNAERRVCIFIPKSLDIYDIEGLSAYFEESPNDNPLAAIRITKDRFSPELSHRDYLGAIMALGIKRDVVGDINVNNDGCDVIVTAAIAKYIKENLFGVGKATVHIDDIVLNELKTSQEKYEEVFHSVASMRLDAVISAAFKLSRTKAVSYILQGSVYVNGMQTLKTDYKLSLGDKLVLRGSGKAIVSQEVGESRKGRQRLLVRIYK